jgi:mono/diheme cytochrome c family protein
MEDPRMFRLYSRTRARLGAVSTGRLLALGAGWTAMAAMACLMAGTPRLHAQPAQASAGNVTPAVGPSWLTIHGLQLSDTAMGFTGAFGPGLSDADGYQTQPSTGNRVGELPVRIKIEIGQPGHSFAMTGRDLYRVSCQACHGEKGEGRPPEIASFAEALKTDSQALGDHLVNGNKRMPPFRRLTAQELSAVRGYVTALAAGNAAASGATVTESYERVGELVAKGTCHICHDATGPGRDPEFLMEGNRPSLTALAHSMGVPQMVSKVLAGALIPMGTPPILHRGRMPVFYYLTQDEIAATFYYLSRFAPEDRPDTVSATDGYAQ